MEYTTAKAEAKRINTSASGLYRYRQKGMPHIVTPTGRILYVPEWTDQWLAGFAVNAPARIPQAKDDVKDAAAAIMAGIVPTPAHIEDNADE
jgi:hypothetical protein